MLLPTNPLVVAFIEKFLHYENAENDFDNVNFQNEKIKDAYFKAFNKINCIGTSIQI